MNQAAIPEARPRLPIEWPSLLPQPEIPAMAVNKGITDILHFTTSQGLVGILASHAIKSRKRLPEDKYLEHVYRPNVRTRDKDRGWLDYISLSISRINDWMFDSSHRWHVKDGVSWAVLSLRPALLADPGIVFTTTNNIYAAVRRAEGLPGFERMFASQVLGYYSGVIRRGPDHKECYPTDRQAEVLYPGELSLDHLQRIDVQTEQCLDDVEGMLGALDVEVQVRLAPEVFV